MCIGYIYLAPLSLPAPLRLCACVCVSLQPHVGFKFLRHMRNQMLPTTTSTSQPFGSSSSCCLTVLCSGFVFCLLFFLFSAVFCFLFGKMQKVYLSAVKTWLQTWNANANLVQSLHYADKPAKNLQLRINPAQQILEKHRERERGRRVSIKFLPQKQVHLRCVTRLHNAVENCQINHSYLYKRP